MLPIILFLTILPAFELLFNRLTPFRLRELCSSDAKLLRKLKEEAPGTYNHSVVVAQLAEACAEALAPVQSEYARLMADKAYLEEVMRKGAEEANYCARKTISKVKKKIGFVI